MALQRMEILNGPGKMDLMLARFDQAYHPYVRFLITLKRARGSLTVHIPVIVLADEDAQPVDAYLLHLRACGEEEEKMEAEEGWRMARADEELTDWVNSAYFFAYYDAHKRRGWIEPVSEETRQLLSRRHEGRIIFDPLTQHRRSVQPTQMEVQS